VGVRYREQYARLGLCSLFSLGLIHFSRWRVQGRVRGNAGVVREGGVPALRESGPPREAVDRQELSRRRYADRGGYPALRHDREYLDLSRARDLNLIARSTRQIRFDPVYVGHFKCNLRTIRNGYPAIHT
jgi:hypothetical protein